MTTGRYQDIIRSAGACHALPWRSNLVVSSCYELVTALIKGEPGASGALWWAVGSGSADPHPGERHLSAEFHRQRVHPEHMRFVDDLGRPSSGPTQQLEVRAAFRAERLAQVPREFGLFGGSASDAPGSGTLINRAVHPPIELAPGDILERRLVLTFGVAAATSTAFAELGVDWPVSTVKGIDTFYAERLRDVNVRTLDELARFVTAEPVAGIPPSRLGEFVEKALAVRRYRPLSLLEALSDRSILEVLSEDLAELAAASGGALSSDQVLDARRSLGILQVALDADVLRRVPVRDLFSPGEAPGPPPPIAVGNLPEELELRFPEPPRISRDVEIRDPGDAAEPFRESGVRLDVRVNVDQLVIAASDVAVRVNPGVRIGALFIARELERIHVSGGSFGRIEIQIPGRFAPPPEEWHEEWLTQDVLFENVEVDAGSGESAFLLRGKRVAIVDSTARAGNYAVWVGDTADFQSEDVILAGNDFRVSGAESTVRLVNVLRSVVVDSRLENPQKHNYRVHGESDLALAARNTLVGGGVMLASLPEDAVGTVWLNDNTLHASLESLLVAGDALARLVARGNHVYSDFWEAFFDEVPPGWDVPAADNHFEAYRDP